jgi:hypothetical protein
MQEVHERLRGRRDRCSDARDLTSMQMQRRRLLKVVENLRSIRWPRRDQSRHFAAARYMFIVVRCRCLPRRSLMEYKSCKWLKQVN